MRRMLARIALLCICVVYSLPLTAFAADKGAPPKEPYEKVFAKSGVWYEERWSYEGQSKLAIGYTGKYEEFADESKFEFSLAEKILLSCIYVPYEGTDIGPVEIMVLDSKANSYWAFTAEPVETGGIGEVGKSGDYKAGQRNTLYQFRPEYNIILPKGDYIIHLFGHARPVDAYLVKGYNYTAYQRYQKELAEWAREDDEEESEDVKLVFGNEELPEIYQQSLEGEEDFEYEPVYEPPWDEAPLELPAPRFFVDGTYELDEIILSVWNGGLGARPGTIYILNENGEDIASFRAQGASQGGVPNTLWVAMPGITLTAGTYYLDMDAPEALDYDAYGEPVFHVSLIAPAPAVGDFTGTYKIWMDLYKTQTLMGPLPEKMLSFSLDDYELTVIDKGSYIELIGKYEDMPFSQNCEVTHRDENSVVAMLNFAANLENLPYKANIGARAAIRLTREGKDRITVSVNGQGFYSRAASKDKGADDNTYELTVRGNRAKKDLPPFVMAAIAKAYGVGNIPGPDMPAEAAVGMLFPPLLGLIVSVIQNLLRPKEIERVLSVGEQAMRDANRSLGKGLYTPDEARAWAMLGEALAGSGGDPQDKISIGDNELREAAELQAARQGGGEGFGAEYVGPDEDLSFGKPDTPAEAPAYEPYAQPESRAQMPVQPESMVVQTSARGAETLIIRDPATGEWINAETGNVFNLEEHRRKFPQQVREFEDYLRRQDELERSGRSAMQIALDEIDRKHREEFAAIQKEIDQRRMEQLKRDQESLEWQAEHARRSSGWGRIAGDWVIGMGRDVEDLGSAVWSETKLTAESLMIMTKDMIFDPQKSIQNIKDDYNLAKDYVDKAAFKAAEVAVEIIDEVEKKPWLAVKGVMEAGKFGLGIMQDPKKQWEIVKGLVGVDDFQASLDPNLPITERVSKVLSGTFKFGTSVGSWYLGGAAARSAAAGAGRAAAGAGRAAATGARAATGAGKAATGVSRAGKDFIGFSDVLRSTRLTPPKPTSFAFSTMRRDAAGRFVGSVGRRAATGARSAAAGARGTGAAAQASRFSNARFVPSGQAANLQGMTKTSQRGIQGACEKYLVNMEMRPPTGKAASFLDSGKAVPKGFDLKAKTVKWEDFLIGGPKNAEGTVGFFRPTRPSAKALQKLSPEQQAAVWNRYAERAREYNKYARELDNMANKYEVINGQVFQRVTTKVKQGGETVERVVLKMITGDNDIGAITDAVTGAPVSYDKAMKIFRYLEKVEGSNVMHPSSFDWRTGGYQFDAAGERALFDGMREGGAGVFSFGPGRAPEHRFLVGDIPFN